MSGNHEPGRAGSEAASDLEPTPALFTRLASAGQRSAGAVSEAATNAVAATKDGLESMRYGVHKIAVKMDKWAADGVVGRTFRFKERSAKFTTELRAGLITFLMVSYILVVNPAILATTGGTCNPEEVCKPENYDQLGPECLADPEDEGAEQCMEDLMRSLITATAASSLISTFFIGYFGNLPLALAPGIGITAYVAYQVVGQFGTGQLTFQQTMTAVFVEGFIFIVLSVTGVRGGIIKYMPKSIAMASSVGIGMLLAFTGLRNLGLIVFDSATLLTLGGCPSNRRNFLYAFDQPVTAQSLANLTFTTFPTPASVHGCIDDAMRSPTMWLGVAGGFLMCILLYMGVKGSLILGILFVTIISWIPGHSASYLGSTSPIPGGQQRLEVFKQVVAAPSLSATGLAWDWSAFNTGKLWVALLTFLYIDLLDCTGTLLSMARLLDFNMPGFLSDNMEFPGQMWAFLSDGIGIVSGSMMGTTSLTVYIESAAGIEDGGRTGLTAVVASFFFFASLFFSPIIASIPPFATGPALVLVGTILLGHIAHIEWDDIGVAIPAFLTMVLMPFTYSVAYGVIAGLASYLAIHIPFWLTDFVRKRWWPAPSEVSSPRSLRARRRSKTGYHLRKTFGPHDDPPSRADSFVGGAWYEDSYRTQDTRRSALPISMVHAPGASGNHGGGNGGGSNGLAMHSMPAGSVPNSLHPPNRSNPPSVVNMFFPENSVRGGTTGSVRGGYGRSRSHSTTTDTELPGWLAQQQQQQGGPNGSLHLFRKSYSMHSPGRELGGGRLMPFGARPLNRSLTDMPGTTQVYGGSPPLTSSPARGNGGGGITGRMQPAPQLRPGLTRELSVGPASTRSGSPHHGLPPLRLGMTRSRTFSHGISDLSQGDDLQLRQQSSSEHGGGLFKLFPDAPDLSSPRHSGNRPFRADIVLPGAEAEMSRQQEEQPFRLFGDIEPLELDTQESGNDGGGANAAVTPSFRLGALHNHDRSDTADLSFGATRVHSVGDVELCQRDSLEATRRGSSAYSDALRGSQDVSLAGLDSSRLSSGAWEQQASAAAAAGAGRARQQMESELEEAPTLAFPPPPPPAPVFTGTSSSGHATEQTGSSECQQGSSGEGGGVNGGSEPGGGIAGGEVDEDQLYSRLMRTLSSKSLRVMSQSSSGAADSGGTTSASTSGKLYADGSLRSGSLAAAARQLAKTYSGRSSVRQSSAEGGTDGEEAASAQATGGAAARAGSVKFAVHGSPPQSGGSGGSSPAGLESGPALLPPLPQQRTSSGHLLPRPSPFEANVSQPEGALPEVVRAASVANASSSAARHQMQGSAASTRPSGLPSDEDWVE